MVRAKPLGLVGRTISLSRISPAKRRLALSGIIWLDWNPHTRLVSCPARAVDQEKLNLSLRGKRTSSLDGVMVPRSSFVVSPPQPQFPRTSARATDTRRH